MRPTQSQQSRAVRTLISTISLMVRYWNGLYGCKHVYVWQGFCALRTRGWSPTWELVAAAVPYFQPGNDSSQRAKTLNNLLFLKMYTLKV